MTRHCLLAAAAMIATLASGSAAAIPRTFVSGTGSDTNPCTRDLPCRSFGTAINAADAGGEVIALDTAGYGPMTINKSISVISPPGIVAAISNGVAVPLPIGNSAAVLVAAGANDRVVLRGLNVNIASGSISGVVIQSAGIVHIESAALKGPQVNTGIHVFPVSSPVKVFIKDTVIRGFNSGIELRGEFAAVRATADRLRVHDALITGVALLYDARAVMRDVTSSGNGYGGFSALSNNISTPASLVLERCTASGNGVVGLLADPLSQLPFGATVTMSNCVVMNNPIGVRGSPVIPIGGGYIFSRINNTVRENGTNVVGDILTESAK